MLYLFCLGFFLSLFIQFITYSSRSFLFWQSIAFYRLHRLSPSTLPIHSNSNYPALVFSFLIPTILKNHRKINLYLEKSKLIVIERVLAVSSSWSGPLGLYRIDPD
ncbi:hypothetical protein BDV59DRAFT_179965 [Aspergillus ambiguus]|uniref:uncharacterized protein n=1 Tax=Aspergillus ambiguus TaxID=176160 RepID=UPI003CCD9879